MIATVGERRAHDRLPLFTLDGWDRRLPWLRLAVTARGVDMSCFGPAPVATTIRHWDEIRHALGFSRAVIARQVHAARILHHDPGPAGILLADDADGHITCTDDTLLAVTIADCVPIAIADRRQRVIALLHAGWRGVAAGILEAALVQLRGRFGTDPADLVIHLGPAICGDCYEVGPEVPAALGIADTGPAADAGRTAHVDLRAILAARACNLGVPPQDISSSAHCTRCAPDAPFYSHRGGDAERQVMLLGIRPAAP